MIPRCTVRHHGEQSDEASAHEVSRDLAAITPLVQTIMPLVAIMPLVQAMRHHARKQVRVASRRTPTCALRTRAAQLDLASLVDGSPPDAAPSSPAHTRPRGI